AEIVGAGVLGNFGRGLSLVRVDAHKGDAAASVLPRQPCHHTREGVRVRALRGDENHHYRFLPFELVERAGLAVRHVGQGKGSHLLADLDLRSGLAARGTSGAGGEQRQDDQQTNPPVPDAHANLLSVARSGRSGKLYQTRATRGSLAARWERFESAASPRRRRSEPTKAQKQKPPGA